MNRRRPTPSRSPSAAAPSRLPGRRAARGLLAAALVLFAGACGSVEDRPRKPAGSAVWATTEDWDRLGTDERQALRDGGVGEVFLVAGRGVTEADGGVGIAVDLGGSPASSAARLPVTLVVRQAGEGDGGGPASGGGFGAEGGAVADGWAGALRRLRLDAQEAGLTVVGYHLDLAPPQADDDLALYGRTLALLRDRLDDGLFLSVSLDPAALALPGAAEVAAGVDFAVAFLYGPRTDGGPGPVGEAAWSLRETDVGLARLAELKLPFLVGVGTVGRLQRLGGEGEWTTLGSLGQLFSTPGLTPAIAGGLEVLDRQSYGFRAEQPLRLGDWRLGRGDEVRVTRLSSYHLQRLAARAEAAPPGLHLGQLYHRLRRPGENLSLPAAALAGANEGNVAADVTVEVEAVGRSPSPFRVRLANRGAQPTEVAFLDNNYLQLHSLGGVFTEVDPGAFQRYELVYQGERVTTRRALNKVDGVKLYVPVLEPGDEVVSGPIVLRGAGRGDVPVVEVEGRFVLPGGEELHLPRQPWPVPAATRTTAGDDTP